MNVEIAERLAARRKEAGLSREVLAERLGVSRQAVSKWERSESSPDTDNLIALAKLYGVSLDDLLYVDGSIEDDVEFEQADRAAERAAASGATQTVGAQTTSPSDASPHVASDDETGPGAEGPAASSVWSEHGWTSKKAPEAVHIGLDGIHVLDGEDYVHVSWRDGVHVKDTKDGDEVHVGWGGVHVKEGSSHGSKHRRREEWSGSDKKRGNDWCAAGDDDGNTVAWTNEGVVINGEHFDNWQDAHDKYGNGRGGHWGRPSGYTVNGEYFDSLKDARARYGDEVGKSIPVRKHYRMAGWMKFPFPLVVIIAYLLLGFMANEWGTGLFVFFTIPLYYMIGHAIETRKIAHFVGGVYPIAVTAWFLWMAFVLNAPHPAWVVFLTIPLVEWAVHSVSRWWRRRKKDQDVIDVESSTIS